MNRYAIALTVLLCSSLTVSADIINGILYEKIKLEREIENLDKLSKEAESVKLSRKFEYKVKCLRKQYAKVCKYYLEAEQLLSEFKIIDPELFERVSKVTNSEGTLTHVYVRYVTRNSKEFKRLEINYNKATGYTSVGQWENSENVCESFYGTNTICVTIGEGCNEKLVLAHEFGHVLYMVPNLKSYLEFMHNYRYKLDKYNKGHSPIDPSTKFVHQIQDNFNEKYTSFLAREEISNQEVELAKK